MKTVNTDVKTGSVGGSLSEGMVLAPVALGTMLAPLNSTMIAVAIPSLLEDFGRSLAWGSWIVTSYLVAMAAVQPLGGALGDRYGRRRLFLIGLTLFLLATVVAALSWRIEALLVARTVQAISGAAAIPNGTALVRSLVPSERRGRAFGNVGAAIAVAASLGPPIGGILTAVLGWRWIFAVNLLLVPALVLGCRLPTDSPGPQLRQFDLRGTGLLASGIVSFVLSLTIWRLPDAPFFLSLALSLFAAGSLLALVRHSRRLPNPVLNLALFRARGFTPAVATVLLSNLVMYTLLLSLPLFLTAWSLWDSAHIGLLLAGLSLPTIVFSPLGGRLSDSLGRRAPAVVGMTLIALGAFPFLVVDPVWLWLVYLVPLIFVGAGLGLSMAPVQTTAIETAPSSQAGQASGLFSTMRYLGSILGSSVMAAVLSGATPPVTHFRILYATLFVSACSATIAALRLPTWFDKSAR